MFLTDDLTIIVGGVAQLVIASSLMLKGIGFDPGQGRKYS